MRKPYKYPYPGPPIRTRGKITKENMWETHYRGQCGKCGKAVYTPDLGFSQCKKCKRVFCPEHMNDREVSEEQWARGLRHADMYKYCPHCDDLTINHNAQPKRRLF